MPARQTVGTSIVTTRWFRSNTSRGGDLHMRHCDFSNGGRHAHGAPQRRVSAARRDFTPRGGSLDSIRGPSAGAREASWYPFNDIERHRAPTARRHRQRPEETDQTKDNDDVQMIQTARARTRAAGAPRGEAHIGVYFTSGRWPEPPLSTFVRLYRSCWRATKPKSIARRQRSSTARHAHATDQARRKEAPAPLTRRDKMQIPPAGRCARTISCR